MKKVLFVFAIAVLSFGAANAQESAGGFHFSGGLRAGLPVGDAADVFSFVIGAELQGEYMFSDKVSGTITTGYSSMMGKDVDGFKFPSAGYVPVLAGVRVYPSSNFFIGGRIGYGIVTGDWSDASGLNYEPQIGYNGTKLQVAIGYNAISKDGGSLSHLGLTALYKFN